MSTSLVHDRRDQRKLILASIAVSDEDYLAICPRNEMVMMGSQSSSLILTVTFLLKLTRHCLHTELVLVRTTNQQLTSNTRLRRKGISQNESVHFSFRLKYLICSQLNNL